ncbi:hypothetical protein BH09ACT13_BH09ACT13_14210 [soil metagenome]
MAALAGLDLVAHGGTPGVIVEALLALTVTAFFVAVWLRERSARRGASDELRDEDERE